MLNTPCEIEMKAHTGGEKGQHIPRRIKKKEKKKKQHLFVTTRLVQKAVEGNISYELASKQKRRQRKTSHKKVRTYHTNIQHECGGTNPHPCLHGHNCRNTAAFSMSSGARAPTGKCGWSAGEAWNMLRMREADTILCPTCRRGMR